MIPKLPAVFALFLLAILGAAQEPAEPLVPLWGHAELAAVRARVKSGDPELVPVLARLRREADAVVAGAPVSVTEKAGTGVEIPSGDPRDYVSISTYYWPDERDPKAPWIKKDGIANKAQIERYDTPRLRRATDRITTASLAWWFTGESRYAQAAVSQLRVWFLDQATRMNPNFAYAQVIPNVNGGKGNAHGLIDSRYFIETLSAVALLETGDHLTTDDRTGLRTWFREYLDWCTTSDLGKREAKALNNHGIYYDCQVLAYALYLGDLDRARTIIEQFGPQRIATQVGADGSLQKELERPIAATYTAFTLTAFAQFTALARHAGIGPDPWAYTSEDGRSIPKALAWTVPFIEGQEWAYGKGLDKFNPDAFTRIFRIAAQVTGDGECLRIARSRSLPADDRMRLLFHLDQTGH